MLPDSFGSAAPLASVVYNPASDRIYVGDESGSILVVDALTHSKQTRISTGARQVVHSLLPIPGTNKLYSAGQTSVKVIDCASNSIVREIPVHGGCDEFAGFDSVGGKAYYIGYDSEYLANAIDVTGDSAVGSVTLGTEVILRACFNVHERKLYLAGSYRHSRMLYVVDARGDSLLRTITLAGDPTALGYNPMENKVYCGYPGGLYVFDGETDSLIEQLAMNGAPCVIGSNPDANKVYCGIGGGGTSLYILDGRTDSTIAVVNVGHGPRAMLYNPVDSNMYVACGDGFELSVIDGQGDSAVAHLSAGLMAWWLTMDTGRNLVYCAARYGDNVSVTHGTTVTPAGVIYVGLRPDAICYDSVGDKVYVANWDPLGCVAVVDCNTNEVVANIRVGQYPQSLCYSPMGNKVYCANEEWSSIGKISVIDAVADTVGSTILTASSAHDVCYNPARNRVYCGHSVEHVTALDAGSDTVVKLIPTPYDGTGLTYVPTYNKLYYSMPVPWDYYLGVIDCATESLTAVLHCKGEAFVGHRASGKVYFVSRDTLKAIDGKYDTLVPPTLEMGTTGMALCWNSTNDKLYWAGAGGICIVDCTSDTIIATVAAGAASLFYESSRNRVYCTGWDWVTVLDGATNRVVATIPVGPSAKNTAYSPPEERLYVANWDGSSLSVIRTTLPGITEQSLGPCGNGHATSATVASTLDRAASPGEMVFDVVGRLVDAHRALCGGNKLAPGVYIVVSGPRKTPRKVVVVQ